MAGRPPLDDGALGGPAYTLSVEGTALLFTLGARVRGGAGNRLAPVDVVLQTDGIRRRSTPSSRCTSATVSSFLTRRLWLSTEAGSICSRSTSGATAGCSSRTFSHREIYPAEMGCGDPLDATVGTPLGGSTLLHMCVDYDELEIARWLLDQGMDVNVKAGVGRDGFGGHTALFNTVVSQPNFWMNYRRRGPFVAPFTDLLLERGAGPHVRASIWKRLHPGHGDPTRTPSGWLNVCWPKPMIELFSGPNAWVPRNPPIGPRRCGKPEARCLFMALSGFIDHMLRGSGAYSWHAFSGKYRKESSHASSEDEG